VDLRIGDVGARSSVLAQEHHLGVATALWIRRKLAGILPVANRQSGAALAAPVAMPPIEDLHVEGLRAALPAGVVEVEYRAARDLAVAAATLVGGNRLGEIAVAQLSSISSVSVVPDSSPPHSAGSPNSLAIVATSVPGMRTGPPPNI